jgi:ribosomal-protein-alanine N-acetyltransferase
MNMVFPDATDGRVRLRAWLHDDLPCVQAASTDQAITEATTVPSPCTQQAGLAFIERQWARSADGQGWSLAIARCADGQAVGCVTLLLRPQPGVAGLGYWLSPPSRGHGYASRAVALLTTWALQVAGLDRVEAWVEPGNSASARVLAGCGYRMEGRLRSFLAFPSRRTDAMVFSRIPSDLD